MLNGSLRTVGDMIFYIFTAIVLCINHVISEKPSDKKKLCKIGKISPSNSTFRTANGYDYRFIADVYVCLHVKVKYSEQSWACRPRWITKSMIIKLKLTKLPQTIC